MSSVENLENGRFIGDDEKKMIFLDPIDVCFVYDLSELFAVEDL